MYYIKCETESERDEVIALIKSLGYKKHFEDADFSVTPNVYVNHLGQYFTTLTDGDMSAKDFLRDNAIAPIPTATMPQTHAEYLKGRIWYYEGKRKETAEAKDKAQEGKNYTEFHALCARELRYEALADEMKDALNNYESSITPEQSPHESVCGC